MTRACPAGRTRPARHRDTRRCHPGLDAYVEAGMDRVTFALPTAPEAETLRTLDEFTQLADRYRS